MIHPTAIIHPDTNIDPSAEIGPYAVIGSDHGHLRLGPGTIVRSHTIIEGGSVYGDRLETGHHALLRTGTEVGANLRIGSYSSLEGGAQIGDYVRIHGRCEVPKGILRHFARLYGDSFVTENRLPPSNVNVLAVMDEGSVVAMNCILLAGVRVGVGAFVGAGQVIRRDVPDAMALVTGRLVPVTSLTWQGYSYPWTGYFREYPAEAIPRIEALHERIMLAARIRDTRETSVFRP